MAEQRLPPSLEKTANIPLFFYCEEVNADTEYLPHSHLWGQVICIKSGVLALNIGGQRFLAPPGFAVWIPAKMEHSSYNLRQAWFRSINIAPRFCKELPLQPCLLNVSPIFTAIVESCFERNMMSPSSKSEYRLCRVLIDEVSSSPLQLTYLPITDDKYLSPILKQLESNPADNTPLNEWASRVYTTERTLSRRCQSELGMSFSEWRQRLRFLHGISLLDKGHSVQDVALEVGYSSASAFIAMFQHIAGTTPDRYRRS